MNSEIDIWTYLIMLLFLSFLVTIVVWALSRDLYAEYVYDSVADVREKRIKKRWIRILALIPYINLFLLLSFIVIILGISIIYSIYSGAINLFKGIFKEFKNEFGNPIPKKELSREEKIKKLKKML